MSVEKGWAGAGGRSTTRSRSLAGFVYGRDSPTTGVDEPVRNLVKREASFPHELQLLGLCRVRVVDMVCEPGPKDLCDLARQVSTALDGRNIRLCLDGLVGLRVSL